MAETVQRLKRAVRPPDGEDWAEDYLALYGHLISAAMCLAHGRYLLNYRVPRRSSWGPGLYQDFLDVVSEHGYAAWQRQENTTSFGFEVFLDKAQSNIAAALDGTTNAWIIHRMRDVEERSVYDAQLLGLWIGVRLRLLGAVLPMDAWSRLSQQVGGTFPWFDPASTEEGTSEHLRELWRTFERYSDTNTAQQEIHSLAGRYVKLISSQPALPPEENREKILLFLWDQMRVSRAGCAGLVLARVNAFKHLTRGVGDRYDFVYAVEWVITAKALQWISDFWRAMVEDAEQLKAQQNPTTL